MKWRKHEWKSFQLNEEKDAISNLRSLHWHFCHSLYLDPGASAEDTKVRDRKGDKCWLMATPCLALLSLLSGNKWGSYSHLPIFILKFSTARTGSGRKKQPGMSLAFRKSLSDNNSFYFTNILNGKPHRYYYRIINGWIQTAMFRFPIHLFISK